MAKQLNIFIENRPGRLRAVTEKLAKCNVNVRAFAVQDRGDYGLVKLILDKPEEAQLALSELGVACALKEILAISIPDKPGNMHRLTVALADQNINVMDAYAFVIEPNKTGICCLEIENLRTTNARRVVEAAGFRVLDDKELYDLCS
jgi:hypothetical protein